MSVDIALSNAKKKQEELSARANALLQKIGASVQDVAVDPNKNIEGNLAVATEEKEQTSNGLFGGIVNFLKTSAMDIAETVKAAMPTSFENIQGNTFGEKVLRQAVQNPSAINPFGSYGLDKFKDVTSGISSGITEKIPVLGNLFDIVDEKLYGEGEQKSFVAQKLTDLNNAIKTIYPIFAEDKRPEEAKALGKFVGEMMTIGKLSKVIGGRLPGFDTPVKRILTKAGLDSMVGAGFEGLKSKVAGDANDEVVSNMIYGGVSWGVLGGLTETLAVAPKVLKIAKESKLFSEIENSIREKFPNVEPEMLARDINKSYLENFAVRNKINLTDLNVNLSEMDDAIISTLTDIGKFGNLNKNVFRSLKSATDIDFIKGHTKELIDFSNQMGGFDDFPFETISDFGSLSDAMKRKLSTSYWVAKNNPKFAQVYKGMTDGIEKGSLAKNDMLEASGKLRTIRELPKEEANQVIQLLYLEDGLPSLGTKSNGYNSLSTKAKQAYDEIRSGMWTAQNANRDAIKYSYGYDKMSDEAKGKLDALLNETFGTPVIGEKIINGIPEKYIAGWQGGKIPGYMPHVRKGDFVVSVKDANGKTLYASNYRTKKEQLEGLSALRNKYGKNGNTVQAFDASQQGVETLYSGSIKGRLETLASEAGIELDDPVLQALIKEDIKESGIKHLMTRENIPGFSMQINDVLEGIEDFFTYSANRIEKSYAGRSMKDAIDLLYDDGKNGIKDYSKRFLTDFMDYTHSNLFGAIRGLVGMQKLSLSVNFLATQVVQGLINTNPKLIAEFGASGSAIYLKNTKDAVLLTKRLLAGQDISSQLKKRGEDFVRFLRQSYKEGVIGGKFTKEVYSNMGRKQKLSTAMGFLTNSSETFNCVHAYISAWDAAKKFNKTWTGEQIAEYAKSIVKDTQYVFSPHEMPEIIRGTGSARAFAQTVFLFKKYGLDIFSMYKDILTNNKNPLSRRMAAGIVGLGTMVAGGGTDALPFKRLIDMGLSNYGIDPDVEIRKKVMDKTGSKMLSDIATNGLFSLVGVDFSRGMGALSEFPFDVLGIQESDTDRSKMARIFGVVGASAYDIWDSAKDIREGNFAKGVSKLMPSGPLQRIPRMLDIEGTGGIESSKGKTVVPIEKLSLWDKTIFMSGLPSLKVSRAFEEGGYQYEQEKWRSDKREDITRRIYEAMKNRDYSAKREALAELVRINDFMRRKGLPSDERLDRSDIMKNVERRLENEKLRKKGRGYELREKSLRGRFKRERELF